MLSLQSSKGESGVHREARESCSSKGENPPELVLFFRGSPGCRVESPRQGE